eukprot:5191509-Pyramimonas_sp.AAC.1
MQLVTNQSDDGEMTTAAAAAAAPTSAAAAAAAIPARRVASPLKPRSIPVKPPPPKLVNNCNHSQATSYGNQYGSGTKC